MKGHCNSLALAVIHIQDMEDKVYVQQRIKWNLKKMKNEKGVHTKELTNGLLKDDRERHSRFPVSSVGGLS